MKIRIISLAIALLALAPLTYAAGSAGSADSDVESIFLNAADDSVDGGGVSVELDDVDMPKAVKNAIPTSSVMRPSATRPASNVTAQLDPKTLDKETQANIGELRKQNKDLQSHLNELNQQMAMLRQAIEASNKMFANSMAAQNSGVKYNPKTQLQPASLIVEPTPSLVSALQTHPKITGSKATSSPPPAIKDTAATPADGPQLSLNESSVVNGEKIPAPSAGEKPVAEKNAAKHEAVPHVLSMGDLLQETHLNGKLPVEAAGTGKSLLTAKEFDEESASVMIAAKKIFKHITQLGLRYLPDDPNVLLKLTAAVFAMFFAAIITAAWPTRRKMQKKEEKKLRHQQKLQAKAEQKHQLQQEKQRRAMELQQQKEQRILQLQQQKQLREQQRLDLQMKKEAEQQRRQMEKEEQRQRTLEQMEQARLTKLAQQEELRLARLAEQEELRLAKLAEQERALQEKNSRRDPEISRPVYPSGDVPITVQRAAPFVVASSIKPDPGMKTMYNIANDTRESIPVKLNLARSYLESGDYEAIKQALRPVFIKGNKLQREEARIILEEAMTVLEQEG